MVVLQMYSWSNQVNYVQHDYNYDYTISHHVEHN